MYGQNERIIPNAKHDEIELMDRHALPFPEVKIVAVLREPAARMHAAFWTYEHYRHRFGATAVGFSAFAAEFVERFGECAREHGWEGCAHRFEAYGARYEKVFYHADQLIKSMYSTFLEGWLQMFGRGDVLVLRTEDVFSKSEKTRKAALLRAVAHLGLDEPTEEVLDRMDRCRENKGDFDVVQRSLHLPGVSALCRGGFPGSILGTWGGRGGSFMRQPQIHAQRSWQLILQLERVRLPRQSDKSVKSKQSDQSNQISQMIWDT